MLVHFLLGIHLSQRVVSCRFGKRPGLPLKWHTYFAGRETRMLQIPHLNFYRYWVIAVVPYLLYAFVNNHSLETCQRIYRVRPPFGSFLCAR